MAVERATTPAVDIRPTTQELKNKIGPGMNVYEVIQSVLAADYRRIFRYNTKLRASQTVEVNPEINDLYAGPEQDLSDRLSNGFVGGFLFAMGTAYSSVVTATQRINDIQPEDGEAPLTFEDKRKRFVKEFSAHPDLERFIPKELVMDLEIDRSGRIWLDKRIDSADELKTDDEREGARRAVIGAEKLYKQLTQNEDRVDETA